MIAGGDAMSCKTVKFPAEAEVGMAMVVLIFANPEKDFSHSLRKRNDARFSGFGSIRAKAIRP